MAGCGYVCPACEGRGTDENGENCFWCADEAAVEKTLSESEEN